MLYRITISSYIDVFIHQFMLWSIWKIGKGRMWNVRDFKKQLGFIKQGFFIIFFLAPSNAINSKNWSKFKTWHAVSSTLYIIH